MGRPWCMCQRHYRIVLMFFFAGTLTAHHCSGFMRGHFGCCEPESARSRWTWVAGRSSSPSAVSSPAHVDEDSPVVLATPRRRDRPLAVQPFHSTSVPGSVFTAPVVTHTPRSQFSCPPGPVLPVPVVTPARRLMTTHSGRTIRLPVCFRTSVSGGGGSM